MRHFRQSCEAACGHIIILSDIAYSALCPNRTILAPKIVCSILDGGAMGLPVSTAYLPLSSSAPTSSTGSLQVFSLYAGGPLTPRIFDAYGKTVGEYPTENDPTNWQRTKRSHFQGTRQDLYRKGGLVSITSRISTVGILTSDIPMFSFSIRKGTSYACYFILQRA